MYVCMYVCMYEQCNVQRVFQRRSVQTIYVLPHWKTNSRLNSISHPVIVLDTGPTSPSTGLQGQSAVRAASKVSVLKSPAVLCTVTIHTWDTHGNPAYTKQKPKKSANWPSYVSLLTPPGVQVKEPCRPFLKEQSDLTWGRFHGGRRPFSQSNRHSTFGTRQTEYHEALPPSANDEVRCDCTFADDGNASWYSVCRMPMVEWRLDCEDCHHLTVVGLHDTGPWSTVSLPSPHQPKQTLKPWTGCWGWSLRPRGQL